MDFMNFQGPGFTMEVPSNWLVTSTPQVQVVFIGPNDQGAKPNLAITIRRVKEGTTLDQIVQSAKEKQQQNYPEYTVIQEGILNNTAGMGYHRVYRWYNQDVGLRVVQQQRFFLVNDALVTLTATREDKDVNEMFDAVFEHMFESFRFER